jgi:nucleoside 2-deoxyribosyltransferase
LTKPTKSLKIGFTGTQEGMKVRQLRCVGQALLCHCLVEYLPLNFHHGDCIGADEQAHNLARALWFKVFIHPADDESRRAFCKALPERVSTPKPFLMRNKDIVDQTDVLIAAPKAMEEEVRSGTWATVRYARKLNRPIYICYPDGRLVFENVPTMQQRWAKKQSPPVRSQLVKSLEQEAKEAGL